MRNNRNVATWLDRHRGFRKLSI